MMNNLLPVSNSSGNIDPSFHQDIQLHWFKQSFKECLSAQVAQAKDMTFIMHRSSNDPRPTWTSYNETHSESKPEVTTVGYMPIIQAPAHEKDTLNTVVRRVSGVTQALGQRYVVLTIDQALFPQLMELKWTVPDYKDILIPRLGGLHTSMNFLKVLGQHTQDTGLSNAWEESGMLGSGTVERVMSGKDNAKATRTHKITMQALWELLLPQLLTFLHDHDRELEKTITDLSLSKADHNDLVDIVLSARFQDQMEAFVNTNTEQNPNFQYWWQYIEMVIILLMFIRAQQDGIWELHLFAFRRMLPFFHILDT